jgi:hypothetical protein
LRRRRYLVNGRLRVPFQGYERRSTATTKHNDAASPVSVFQRLTSEQKHLAQHLLNRADQERDQLRGPRLAGRIAGIVSAVKNGRVGNSAWGWSMHGRRGGLVMARHGLHILKANARKGGQVSGAARHRRKAEQGQACQRPALPLRHNELEERWQRLREEAPPPKSFLAM